MQTTDGRPVSTGVDGLDRILHGGLLPGRAYQVRGGPGTGKTTLGTHFLATVPPQSLFITLGENEARLRQDSANAGIDLSDVTILDVSPDADDLAESTPGDVFSSAETARAPLLDRIQGALAETRPTRIFVDSLTQFRYLTEDAYQFRKQIMTLLQCMTEGGATVLFTSEASPGAPDEDLQFIADGIIDLARDGQDRTLRVLKLRGAGFSEGPHAFRLSGSGMSVFPRLVPDAHGASHAPRRISLGLEKFDELIGGGIDTGTTTLISGPTGVGKTTLGLQILKAAAEQGERSVLYTFEEHLGTLLHRSEALGIALDDYMRSGQIGVTQIEPHDFIPDEFALQVRDEVERRDVRLVMIDSIGGYSMALDGDDGALVLRLRALTRYLFNMDVSVLLINEVQTVYGAEFKATERGVSPIADAVVVLRYIELAGGIGKAIGVLKKRTGPFEPRFREFSMGEGGMQVGRILAGMRGIMAGMPEVVGASATERGERADGTGDDR